MKHLDIEIKGDLSNIGFRFQVMKAASQMEICGRIEYDTRGNICIEAEGEHHKLEEFIRLCTEIPGATINSLIFQDGIIRNYKEFEII